MPQGWPIAVRSSAATKTACEHSFAGQLDELPERRAEDVRAASATCGARRSSDRALAYRRERGLPARPHPPAVLCSGWSTRAWPAWRSAPIRSRAVAASPSSARCEVWARRSCRVKSDADTWHVDRDGAIRRAAPSNDSVVEHRGPVLTDEHQRSRRRVHRGTTVASGCALRTSTAGHRVGYRRPALSASIATDHVAASRSRSRRRAHHLGQQQHRRELQRRHDAADVLVRAEIYEHVYRQFCRMMGVPRRVIATHDATCSRTCWG